jgi:hypothetical protein
VSNKNQRLQVLFPTLLLLVAACNSSVSEPDKESQKQIPTFKVYLGMSSEEFAEANKEQDGTLVDSGPRYGISEEHNIYYWDKIGNHSVLLTDLGGDLGSATMIAIDHGFGSPDDRNYPLVQSVTVHLYRFPVYGIQQTFDEAHQVCRAVIDRLEAAGWTGTTEEFYAREAPINGWDSFSALRSKLPNEPKLSGVGVDERRFGDVIASCAIVRNNFVARDMGFTNGTFAYGNDPNAKMYSANLSFLHPFTPQK